MKSNIKKTIAWLYIIISVIMLISYIYGLTQFLWNNFDEIGEPSSSIYPLLFGSIHGMLLLFVDMSCARFSSYSTGNIIVLIAPIIFFALSIYFIWAAKNAKDSGNPWKWHLILAITSIANLLEFGSFTYLILF